MNRYLKTMPAHNYKKKISHVIQVLRILFLHFYISADTDHQTGAVFNSGQASYRLISLLDILLKDDPPVLYLNKA